MSILIQHLFLNIFEIEKILLESGRDIYFTLKYLIKTADDSKVILPLP
jgi:hypothetical protein